MGNLIQINTNNLDLQELLDSITKKESLDYTFTDDLLALSCCLYRITFAGKSHQVSHLSLDDPSGDLAKLVCDLDRAKAEKIRKFYKDKFLLLKLKGHKFSKFRNELLDFLYRDDRRTYPYNYIGMAYRLPYFFQYDISIEEIFGSSYFQIQGPKHRSGISKLRFIKKLNKQTRQVNNIEFWFALENEDRVLISIQAENPLLPLFERFIKQSDIELDMILYAKKKDMLNYYNTQVYNFT